MASVKAGELSLVEAAAVLGLCYRQTKRVWRRYRKDGDRGLVHRLGDGRANSASPKRCGPRYWRATGSGIRTLGRRWRRRQRHRQWRERKPCFGAMVQLDGSHHDWFEGRGERCVLMVMVDDATNRVWARFFEEETTRASYDLLEGWIKRHGMPQSLYVDRDSIYRCEGLGSIAQQIAGQEPQTQFGRAMRQLGVGLILANSPQAQGAGGTDERGIAGSVGQGATAGRDQRQGSSQPVFSQDVSGGIQPEVCRGSGEPGRRASERPAKTQRDTELGGGPGGATGLDGGVWRQMVSSGPATPVLESGGQESDRANAAGRLKATGAQHGQTQVAGTAGTAIAGKTQTDGRAQKNSEGQQAGGGSSVADHVDRERAAGHAAAARASGGGGFRSAFATLRPPSLPHH